MIEPCAYCGAAGFYFDVLGKPAARCAACHAAGYFLTDEERVANMVFKDLQQKLIDEWNAQMKFLEKYFSDEGFWS